MAKISVIMSVRNGEKYLQEAVGSILRQSYKDFEFIIVDDCSRDKTAYLLKRVSDPRVRIITNSVKKGLTASLNFALKKSKGKFIARMDSDDVAAKDRLKKQALFLEENPAVGVIGS